MKKENNQTTNENAFATLLRNYENATRNGNNEKESIELCTACAYSVLKKCIDVSQSKPLQAIKRDIAKDNNHLKAIANCNTNYTLDYNQDGDLIQHIKDKTLHQAFDKLVSEIKRICTDKPYTQENCIKRSKFFDKNERFNDYITLFEGIVNDKK